MTFFFKEPPAQEIMPRMNLYHPDDHHKEVEDRRLIASFKTTVKCFKPDVLNICPDCKEDRQGWEEGHEHECLDTGPANPSGRRHALKVKYGAKKRVGLSGWKKRKNRTEPEVPEVPEYQPASKGKKKKVAEAVEDPLELLKAANPDIDPAVLERAVANMLDKGVFAWKTAPDSRKRGAEEMLHATPNPYKALTLDEASTSSDMVVTTPTKPPTKVPHHTNVPPHQPSPAKGSEEELALINGKKKD
jgi:hypothetical protein